jgi:transposase
MGYAGLAPTIKQSGQSSWIGRISKTGSPTLRWAAIEAAQHSWRPLKPWNRLYIKTRGRHGKANPAKAAVARKVLIACWHVLSRQQPFQPHTASSPEICPGKLPRDMAA